MLPNIFSVFDDLNLIFKQNKSCRSNHTMLRARTREQDGGCWSQKSNVQLTVVRGSQTMSEDGHEDVGEAGGGGREAYWATDQTIVPVLLMHGAASSL